MRKTKKKKHIFLNEYLLLTTKLQVNRTNSDENGASQEVKPLQLKGWLISEDGTHLYLGDEPDEISFYIRKDEVVYVERLTLIDELDEKLDEYRDGISN